MERASCPQFDWSKCLVSFHMVEVDLNWKLDQGRGIGFDIGILGISSCTILSPITSIALVLCLRVLTIIQESDEDCFYSCNTVNQVNFTATWIWPVTFVISRWSMRVDRFHLIIKQVVQTLNISLYDFTHWTQHYRIANPLIVFHHDHVAWTKDEECVKWVK